MVVATASSLNEALTQIAAAEFDLAVLDINLAGTEVYPAAELLRGSIVQASQDLADYAAIPQDFDTSCRCGSTANHALPTWFADQVLDLI